MKIYDVKGNELLDAELTLSAQHEEELAKSDFVKLSWDDDTKVKLPAGAYIVPFEDSYKYSLLEPYEPTQTDNGFKYEPEFQHPKMWLSKLPLFATNVDSDGNEVKQQEWSFSGLTASVLQYICDAVNTYFGFTGDDKVTLTMCGTVDSSVSVSFNNNDVISAINAVASACTDNTCDWHLDWEDKALYFGQVSINRSGALPVLKVDDNVQKVSVTKSSDLFYNVFYPQGSTRNMSRKADSGRNISANTRLGLNTTTYPDGCIYVDEKGNVITKAAFEASGAMKQMYSLSFDSVYPHINLYAYNIRGRRRYLRDSTTKEYALDSQGNLKYYTIWYMRLAYPTTVKDSSKTLLNTTVDEGVTHYWYDYDFVPSKQIISGYTLCGAFGVNTSKNALPQPLIGLPSGSDGFELTYHETDMTYKPDEASGDSGVEIKKGDYEIVLNQSGDVIIPSNEDENLVPHGHTVPDITCNVVILYNIIMGTDEVTTAQTELAVKAIKEIKRRYSDTNNYSFVSDPASFESNNPKLYIGEAVEYDDGNGYTLATRVTKLITKIDCPIEQTITVGNQAIKGTISQLKENVANIMAGTWSGGGGLNSNQIQNIIKSYGERNFLSKLTDDTANGLITFLKGLVIGNTPTRVEVDADGNVKSQNWSINKEGIGKLVKLFSEEISNSGMITTTNLTVTGVAHFFKLIIDEIKSAGGSVILTASDGFTIDFLTTDTTAKTATLYWRCKEGKKVRHNMWSVGDQALCKTFNLGDDKSADQKFYWCYVTAVSNKAVTVYADADGKVYTSKPDGIETTAYDCNYITVSTDTATKQSHYIAQTNPDGSHAEKAEFLATGEPSGMAVGDEIVMLGHRPNATADSKLDSTDASDLNYQDAKSRGGALYLAAYTSIDNDLRAPLIAQYAGIDDFDLASHRKTYFALSNAGTVNNRVVGDFAIVADNGEEENVIRYRGAWEDVNRSTLRKNDVVVYKDVSYICNTDKTTEKPGTGSAWSTFGKGKDGVIGKNASRYYVLCNPDTLHRSADGKLYTNLDKAQYLNADGTVITVNDASGNPQYYIVEVSAMTVTGYKHEAGSDPVAMTAGDGFLITVVEHSADGDKTYYNTEGNAAGGKIVSGTVTFQPSINATGIDVTLSKDSVTYDSHYVGVTQDGKDGKNGEAGKDGKDGTNYSLAANLPSYPLDANGNHKIKDGIVIYQMINGQKAKWGTYDAVERIDASTGDHITHLGFLGVNGGIGMLLYRDIEHFGASAFTFHVTPDSSHPGASAMSITIPVTYDGASAADTPRYYLKDNGSYLTATLRISNQQTTTASIGILAQALCDVTICMAKNGTVSENQRPDGYYVTWDCGWTSHTIEKSESSSAGEYRSAIQNYTYAATDTTSLPSKMTIRLYDGNKKVVDEILISLAQTTGGAEYFDTINGIFTRMCMDDQYISRIRQTAKNLELKIHDSTKNNNLLPGSKNLKVTASNEVSFTLGAVFLQKVQDPVSLDKDQKYCLTVKAAAKSTPTDTPTDPTKDVWKSGSIKLYVCDKKTTSSDILEQRSLDLYESDGNVSAKYITISASSDTYATFTPTHSGEYYIIGWADVSTVNAVIDYITLWKGITKATAWTPANDDDRLLDTGVDVADRKVRITSDNFLVQSNSGYKTLEVTEDGKIGAKSIEAQKVVTEALQSGTITAGKATIENLKLTNADLTGTITNGERAGSFVQVTFGGGKLQTKSYATAVAGSTGYGFCISAGNTDWVYTGTNHNNKLVAHAYIGERARWDTNGNMTGYTAAFLADVNCKASGIDTTDQLCGFGAEMSDAGAFGFFTNGRMRANALNLGVGSFVSTETLTSKSPSVIMAIGGDITFPDKATVGQMFIIIQTNTTRVNFHGKFRRGSKHQTSCSSNAEGRINIFIFDGDEWHCGYLAGNIF